MTVTRGCIDKFVSPDDEHDVLETCRVIYRKKYIEKNLCFTLVIYQGSWFTMIPGILTLQTRF